MVGRKKHFFWPKIYILKGNHCFLRTGSPSSSKIAQILEKKSGSKMDVLSIIYHMIVLKKISLSLLILGHKCCI